MQRLGNALAVSLSLHLLVLWPKPAHLPSLTEGRFPLHATLRPPAIDVPARETAVAVAPRLVPPRSATGEPMRRPVAEPPPAPRLASVPSPDATPSTVPPVPTPAPIATTPTVPGAVVPTHSAEVLLTEAGAGGDTLDGLRGYRLAIASQARRFKRYPALAMEAGWSGSVDVRVEVGADGRPRPASVSRSSGHEVLDRAALNMIDSGALRARLPDSLRGRVFAVSLPVVFDLDEK